MDVSYSCTLIVNIGIWNLWRQSCRIIHKQYRVKWLSQSLDKLAWYIQCKPAACFNRVLDSSIRVYIEMILLVEQWKHLGYSTMVSVPKSKENIVIFWEGSYKTLKQGSGEAIGRLVYELSKIRVHFIDIFKRAIIICNYKWIRGCGGCNPSEYNII